MPALDLNWVDTRNKKSQMKLEKLDNDLKNYKSNSIKVNLYLNLLINTQVSTCCRRASEEVMMTWETIF